VQQPQSWFAQKQQELVSCWRVPGADEALAARVRAKQLVAVHRLIPFTMSGNVLTALLITLLLGKSQPFALAAGWMLLVFCVAIAWGYVSWRSLNSSEAESASARVVSRSISMSNLMAVMWALMSAYLMPNIDDDGRLLLATIVTGFICVGSFGLATLPQAGVAWVAVLSLGMGYGLMHSGREIYGLLTVLLLMYASTIIVVVLMMSRTFIARLQAEAETEKQKQLVDLLLHDFEEHASDWLWETDKSGRLSHVSVRLAEILQRPIADLMGTPLIDIAISLRPQHSSSNEEAQAFNELHQRFVDLAPFREQVVPVHLGGQDYWWAITAKPLFDARGELTGWRGIGSDVTEARRREREMQQLANFDSLTGLANRHQFRLSLDRALEGASAAPCALLLLDLDNFKAVNDSLGHGFGDRLLQVVAKRLKTRVKEHGVLARLGGDEFALIYSRVESISDIAGLPGSMLDALSEPCYIDGIRLEMRASIGVALAPQDGDTAEMLLKSADMALYAAKESGRNTVCFYDAGMDERARHRLTLQNDLAKALEGRQFELNFQPQIDLATNRITGFEALLRWRHPERGFVSPGEFIPVAEETGLIVSIGDWVLQAACEEALRWPDDLVIAVNLSAVQFRTGSVVDLVATTLARTGLPACRLELEITESSLVQDSAAARETLQALREMSVRIALDDFGTGYSSLAYLRIFPLDRLKIDRSFVSVLDDKDSSESHAIVRTIIHLAAALQLQTTAEGVETEAQRDTLREKGCRDMQGYLVSRPLPADKVMPFVESWKAQHAM
jgi:diguanylate cyclase (GGDEF)-like protein